MNDEIEINGIKIKKSIIYNAALDVLNKQESLLAYIDSTDTYKKYKLLEILTTIGHTNYFKERMKWPEMDRWENATGEFGLEKTNPILVSDCVGEMAYLSHLRWNGKPVVFFNERTEMPAIDVAVVFSLDGDHMDSMYFDIFHRYQSKSVPRGYTWAEKADGLTGSGCVIQETMRETVEMIYKDAQGMFGVPVVSPQLRKFNAEAAMQLWTKYKQSRLKA